MDGGCSRGRQNAPEYREVPIALRGIEEERGLVVVIGYSFPPSLFVLTFLVAEKNRKPITINYYQPPFASFSLCNTPVGALLSTSINRRCLRRMVPWPSNAAIPAGFKNGNKFRIAISQRLAKQGDTRKRSFLLLLHPPSGPPLIFCTRWRNNNKKGDK
jgi:hypothetical protein